MVGVDAPLPKRPPAGLLAVLVLAPPKRPPEAGVVELAPAPAPAPDPPPNMPPVEGVVDSGCFAPPPNRPLPPVAGVVEAPPNSPPPEAWGVLAEAAPPKSPPAGFCALLLLLPSVFVAPPTDPKENFGVPALEPPKSPPEAGAVDVALLVVPLDEFGVPNVKDMVVERFVSSGVGPRS